MNPMVETKNSRCMLTSQRKFFSLLLAYFIAVETVYPITPGDIKRMTLKSDTPHTFTVTLNLTQAQKWEGFIFQIHTQRNQIILSETQIPFYGRYSVGTNIGLWRALSNDSADTYTYYVNISCSMSCGNKSQEDVPVLAALTTVDVLGELKYSGHELTYYINVLYRGCCLSTKPLFPREENVCLNNAGT